MATLSDNGKLLFNYYRTLLTILVGLECLYFSFFVVMTPLTVLQGNFNLVGFAWCLIGSSMTTLCFYCLRTKRLHGYRHLFRALFTWLLIVGALIAIGWIGFVGISTWLAGEMRDWLSRGVAGYVGLIVAVSTGLLALGAGLRNNRTWAQRVASLFLLIALPYVVLLLPFTGMTPDHVGVVAGITVVGIQGVVLCLSLRSFLE